MKAILEEYGLWIVALICVLILVVFAPVISNQIKATMSANTADFQSKANDAVSATAAPVPTP